MGPPDSATVTIWDNEGTIEFTAAKFAVNENAGYAIITVKRTGDTNSAVNVDYATSNGTATTGLDYVATNATLNFGPGEIVKTFIVPIIDDALVEANETVNLTLQNPTGGTPLGGQNKAILTIFDDDTALEFAASTFTANENGTNAAITVRRIGVSTNKVTVDYATSDGTAKAGVKYVAQNGTLSFAGDAYVHSTNGTGTLVFRPGETNKTITIAIIDEQLGEGDQTFNVSLTNVFGPQSGALPGSATLGQITNAVVTIADNETPGNVDYEFNPGAVDGRVRSLSLQ